LPLICINVIKFSDQESLDIGQVIALRVDLEYR
jgi:hypothetical protein